MKPIFWVFLQRIFKDLLDRVMVNDETLYRLHNN